MYGSEENFSRAYFYAFYVVPGSSTMPNTLIRHKLCYECIISSSELLWTIFFVRSGLLPRGHHVLLRHRRLPPRLRRLLRRPVQLWRLLHDDAKLLLLRSHPPPSAAAAGQRHVSRSRRLQRWGIYYFYFFLRRSRQVLERWELLFLLWAGEQFVWTYKAQLSIYCAVFWLHKSLRGGILYILYKFPSAWLWFYELSSGWDLALLIGFSLVTRSLRW